MILMASGHRPKKLGAKLGKDPYGVDALMRLVGVAREALVKLNPTVVVTGGALGWDQAVAIAALQMGLPHWLFIVEGLGNRWPQASQNVLQRIRDQSEVVHVRPVHNNQYVDALMARNSDMLGVSDHVLLLWNGKSGGTWDVVKKVRHAGLGMTNVYDRL